MSVGEVHFYEMLQNSENTSLFQTVNQTMSSGNSSLHSPDSTLQTVVIILEKVLMPIICVTGILGNTASGIVFLKKPLHQSSCGVFLATRSLVDNIFLLCLLLVWVSSTFKLYLSQIADLCKVLMFLTYICGCLSVWMVVLVTFENYIRICRPVLVQKICNPTSAKIIIAFVLFLLLSFYQLSLWIYNESCMPIKSLINLTHILVVGDTFVTLIVPTVIIFFTMAAITITLLRSHNFRKRSNVSAGNRNRLSHITGLLYSVTLSFFCLSLPSHFVRIRLMIMSYNDQIAFITMTDVHVQSLALLVYYLSLAINIVIYYIFGTKFREIFKKTFLSRCEQTEKRYRLASWSRDSVHSSRDTIDSRGVSEVPLTSSQNSI